MFRDVIVDLLKRYFVVGGVPEAVGAYAARSDFSQVREIQRRILYAFGQDFFMHAPNVLVPRIRLVWDSALSQLARENWMETEFSPSSSAH